MSRGVLFAPPAVVSEALSWFADAAHGSCSFRAHADSWPGSSVVMSERFRMVTTRVDPNEIDGRHLKTLAWMFDGRGPSASE